jgi:hypothetical protein
MKSENDNTVRKIKHGVKKNGYSRKNKQWSWKNNGVEKRNWKYDEIGTNNGVEE